MPSAREEIAKLQSDLEYSAFLNKGVLQTNAEYKIRIAELEAENKALRRSERQLTRVEDEMESAQKLLQEWELAGEQWKKEAKALRRELKEVREARRLLEVENQGWTKKLGDLAVVLDNVRGSVVKACEDTEVIIARSSRGPQATSAAGSSRPKRVLSPDPAPAALPSASGRRTKRVRSHSQEEEETPSPTMPAPRTSTLSTPRLTKRRGDGPVSLSRQSDSLPKASTTRTKEQPVATSGPSKRDTMHKASNFVHTRRSDEEFRVTVKDEPDSPISDEDDDPLAMSEVDI